MTSDFDLDSGIGGERCRYDVENRVGVGFQRRAPGFEGYATEHDGRLGLGEEDRTTCRIDTRARRGTGAFVLGVVNAVAVRIRRTSLRVHAGPGHCSGALVDPVVHAVAIGVFGATAGIDLRVLDRIGTGIEAVEHAVAVGIGRAAARVHHRAYRCARAGILAVGYAVLVGVTERTWTCEDG